MHVHVCSLKKQSRSSVSSESNRKGLSVRGLGGISEVTTHTPKKEFSKAQTAFPLSQWADVAADTQPYLGCPQENTTSHTSLSAFHALRFKLKSEGDPRKPRQCLQVLLTNPVFKQFAVDL